MEPKLANPLQQIKMGFCPLGVLFSVVQYASCTGGSTEESEQEAFLKSHLHCAIFINICLTFLGSGSVELVQPWDAHLA